MRAAPLLVLLLAGCGTRYLPAVAPVPSAAAAEIETTLYLVGDAGAPAARGEPVLQALGLLLDADPARSRVLFLGDNIYPRGLPDSASREFAEAARRLEAQVATARSRGVPAWFVPGNHDWDRFGPDGWNAIRRQTTRLAESGGGLVRMLPADGCPGPEIVDEGRWLRLVLVDTQWWLQPGARPHDAASHCATWSEEMVVAALEGALASAGDRRVVVAGHHPLASGGEHGGFYDWRDHLFPLRHLSPLLWIPLPGLGSVYPIARNLGISRQDLSSAAYGHLREAWTAAFAAMPPLVYAAGHDHGLQLLEGGAARYELVSGAGIYGHHSPLRTLRNTRLALAEAGFMRLDLLQDGRVRLGVITVDRRGTPQEVYAAWLDPNAQSGQGS